MTDRHIIRDAWRAVCSWCQHKHQMPLECLRGEWQAMDCDVCGVQLEYCGQHTPSFTDPEDFDVCTRLAPPRRIQLSRAKGWRMPANTVSVARPTKWGNPFKVAPAFEGGGVRIPAITPQLAVELFQDRYVRAMQQWAGTRAAVAELRGKNLACWCKPGAPCHADVLLELANADDVVRANIEQVPS